MHLLVYYALKGKEVRSKEEKINWKPVYLEKYYSTTHCLTFKKLEITGFSSFFLSKGEIPFYRVEFVVTLLTIFFTPEIYEI